jgi:sec-independent protein translocase protein TatA
MMGLDNPLHIAFLLVLLLLVFGAKRLPEMGRSLGSGLRGFKESINGEHAPGQIQELPAAHAETTERTDDRAGDRAYTAPAA